MDQAAKPHNGGPLVCHPGAITVNQCAVRGDCYVCGRGRLLFAYQLTCDLSRLNIPSPRRATRASGLWKHSCFEAFIRRAGHAGYLEFNFSPSAEWAAYGFTAYREPDSRPVDLPAPGITVRHMENGLALEAALDIGDTWTDGDVLEIGLAAVLESRTGELSYWALGHPAIKPDFHHPGSFALSLAMDVVA